MKKVLLGLTALGLVLGIVIFIGCQKGKLSEKKSLEKNVQLVPLDTARNVAIHLNPSTFFNAANASNNSPFHSPLNGNNVIKNYAIINDNYGNPAIYVFNFMNDNGFTFVSADYQLQPVLAFIEHGEFKKDTVPSGIIQWAAKTINNIETVRKGLYDNSKLAKTAWQNYFNENDNQYLTKQHTQSTNGTAPPPPSSPCLSNPAYYTETVQTVGPLLPVTWGQDCSYNDLCPNGSCIDCSSNAVTGCVATAMAQVIAYWHPANSYDYNYTSMPATSGNGEVQRLMSNAGTTVGMSYGCATNGGSNADGGNVPGALKTNFGFTSANRSSYGIGSYANVQNNLMYNWPVLLRRM